MKINFYINIVFSFILISGCAYYNTFYNAQKSFDDAELLIDKSKKSEDSDIPQQAKKLLSQSIEKSQKVIEKYPDSQWIDDSYFLIAKSSFIKGDYKYSEKYFRKILKEYPNSNLFIESKLWLSYTLLKNNMLDSSLFYISALNNDAELNDKHKFLKYTILAEIDIFNNNYDSAYVNFEKSSDYIKIDSKKSSIYERLVKISENQNDKIKSIYFLDKLNLYAQDEDLRHESKLKWLKYNRESGNLKDVSIEIDKLLTRSEYEKIYLSLELEKIKILLSENNFDAAKDNLLYIVENNTKKKETAEAHYLLGLHYLKNEWDLDKAKEYFSNVKIEYSRSIYLDNAIDLKNTIEKFQGLERVFDSQQSGDTSMVEFTIDEEEKVDISLDLNMNMSGLSPSLSGYSNPNINLPDFEEDNLSSIVIKGTIDSLIFAMGEILYFDFQQLDSAESKFNYLYKNHPDSKFTPQSIYILSNTVKDSLIWREKLITEYPENQFSKALQGIEIEVNDNDLLENNIDTLWEEVGVYPDSTAKQFLDLSDTYGDSKSLYSAAYIYDFYLNDISNSIKYYKILVDSFPDSDFNSKALIRLEVIESAISDTITSSIDSLVAINNDSLSNEIVFEDTVTKDIQPVLPPFPDHVAIDSNVIISSGDSIKDKLNEEQIVARIDTLKNEFIEPLKDDIVKLDYEIEEIIHWNDHIIMRGETLESISYQYYQNIQMVDSIFTWNSNVFDNDKNIIYPYTIIKLKSDKIINKTSYFNDHKILSGQTLWSISKKKLNDPYAWILIYNDNKDLLINGANNLKPGVVIKIRDVGSN